jgi:hypothetical protein
MKLNTLAALGSIVLSTARADFEARGRYSGSRISALYVLGYLAHVSLRGGKPYDAVFHQVRQWRV